MGLQAITSNSFAHLTLTLSYLTIARPKVPLLFKLSRQTLNTTDHYSVNSYIYICDSVENGVHAESNIMIIASGAICKVIITVA